MSYTKLLVVCSVFILFALFLVHPMCCGIPTGTIQCQYPNKYGSTFANAEDCDYASSSAGQAAGVGCDKEATKKDCPCECAVPRNQREGDILTFSGGGFRALAVHTGVINGIRNNLNITLRDFYKTWNILGGNSGGAWFLTLSVYSKNFHKIVDSTSDLLEKDNYPYECKGNPIAGSRGWDTCGVLDPDLDSCGSSECCCPGGYKWQQDGLIGKMGLGTDYCRKCAPPSSTPLSILEYFQNAVLSAARLQNKKENALTKALINILPGTEDDRIKPFLYFMETPWQQVVKEIVLDPAGDALLSVSSNPNNLQNHLVWAGVVLRDAVITHRADPGFTKISYGIRDPNCGGNVSNRSDIVNSVRQCGVGFPITMDWDLASGRSLTGLWNGKSSPPWDIQYFKDDEPIDSEIRMGVLLRRRIDSSYTTQHVCAISGAALAAIATNTSLENAARNISKSKFFPSAIAGNLAAGLSALLDNCAIPVKLSPNGPPTFFTNGEVPNSLQPPYFTPPIVRLGDGGYYDNQAVGNAIAVWQKKGNTGTCKIVTINTETTDAAGSWGGKHFTSPNIWSLFGCERLGECNATPTHNAAPSTIHSKFYLKSPILFKSSEINSGAMVWWSKRSTSQVALNYYNCTTIQNDDLGIKAGTPVQLSVIDAFSPLPTFTDPAEGSSTVQAAIDYADVSKTMSDLIQSIPSSLLLRFLYDKPDNLPSTTSVIPG
jgi:hypothetical protein